MSGTGGYTAKNGARDAPVHKKAGNGSTLGDDFPMLCETCLGPNPYVRMTKTPFGDKLCKISNVPYQGFKWKAGPGGRYKETIICYTVAAQRNICQTCLNDMVYGLPVGVRDAMLAKPENQIALPNSIVGQQYFYEQQAQLVANGEHQMTTFSTDLANVVPSRQLDQLSRSMQYVAAKSKTAFRNLPKLCSFWLNGSCTRVLRKTCPFRPCCGTFVFPEIIGSDRELCMELVKQLEAEGPAAVQTKISAETRAAFQKSWKDVNRDDAIRKRVQGDDDLTKKYLGKMKTMNIELEAPEDQEIVTLWLGNVDPDLSEADIRTALYPYGLISSVNLVRSSKCAFVEYVDRGTAENAARQMHNALVINGKPITVNWAKPRVLGNVDSSTSGSQQQGSSGVCTMLPPPGMESATYSSYALHNMPPPDVSVTGTVRPRESDSAGMGRNKRVASGGGEGDESESAGGPEGGGSYITSFSSAPSAVQQQQQQRPSQQQHQQRGPPPRPYGQPPQQQQTGGFRPPPPPPKVMYPSMNPTRMGASI